MRISIIGRQMNVYDSMKALIERKLSKLDRFFNGNADAVVTMSCKRNEKNLEITVSAMNTLFRSEARDDSFEKALDDAMLNMERQIRKNKTKLARKIREGMLDFSETEWEEESNVEDSDEGIIRTKTFPIKPMSAEEAILEMNLLGHQFFVFNNDENGKTCVVYARKDGAYGLIVPEE